MSDRRFWHLKCATCGAAFDVGKDALIVTDEDALSAVDSYVVFGNKTRHPDLVGPAAGPLDEAQWQDVANSMKSIFADIEAGNPRGWHHKGDCDALNPYPAETKAPRPVTSVRTGTKRESRRRYDRNKEARARARAQSTDRWIVALAVLSCVATIVLGLFVRQVSANPPKTKITFTTSGANLARWEAAAARGEDVTIRYFPSAPSLDEEPSEDEERAAAVNRADGAGAKASASPKAVASRRGSVTRHVSTKRLLNPLPGEFPGLRPFSAQGRELVRAHETKVWALWGAFWTCLVLTVSFAAHGLFRRGGATGGDPPASSTTQDPSASNR